MCHNLIKTMLILFFFTINIVTSAEIRVEKRTMVIYWRKTFIILYYIDT
jgi:hypothetical protein